jgi:hypothetical protein
LRDTLKPYPTIAHGILQESHFSEEIGMRQVDSLLKVMQCSVHKPTFFPLCLVLHPCSGPDMIASLLLSYLLLVPLLSHNKSYAALGKLTLCFWQEREKGLSSHLPDPGVGGLRMKEEATIISYLDNCLNPKWVSLSLFPPHCSQRDVVNSSPTSCPFSAQSPAISSMT